MFRAYGCSFFTITNARKEQNGYNLTSLQSSLTLTCKCQKKPFELACQKSSYSANDIHNIAKNIGTGTSRTSLKQCRTSPGSLPQCSSIARSKTNGSTTFQTNLRKQLDAFYRFSRPHTIIGTVIGITSVSLLPLQSVRELSPVFLAGLLKALIPSLSMNIYVVGLNQLFDVEIDKVNKPNLPLASGEFSMELGMIIVSTFLLMSFAMGIIFESPPLLSALLISFLLGSAYSVELPLLRWKRHAVLAASCILIVRAIVVQFAFFLHIQKYVLDRPIMFTKSLVFAVAFMCLFTTVIALFKDIPDVDGDRDFGIQSLSVSLGQKKVFWLCISMMLMAYGAAVVIGASSPFLPSRLITVIGHLSLAFFLWDRAGSVDLNSKASVTSFYMLIWKLFYAEYFLIPFVR